MRCAFLVDHVQSTKKKKKKMKTTRASDVHGKHEESIAEGRSSGCLVPLSAATQARQFVDLTGVAPCLVLCLFAEDSFPVLTMEYLVGRLQLLISPQNGIGLLALSSQNSLLQETLKEVRDKQLALKAIGQTHSATSHAHAHCYQQSPELILRWLTVLQCVSSRWWASRAPARVSSGIACWCTPTLWDRTCMHGVSCPC